MILKLQEFNIDIFETFWANFVIVGTILAQILANCPTIVKVTNQIYVKSL